MILPSAPTSPVVDSHVHVWNLERAEYSWPIDGPLFREIDVPEIAPALNAAGINQIILVQAADNAEDTANMIAVADRNPIVTGIVGWVPLDDADAAAQLLASYEPDRRIVGIRSLLHTRPDPAWITQPTPDATLALIEAAGLTFDYVTGSPASLMHLPGIGERHPTLRIVLDHLGKPPIGGTTAERREWRSLLASAAENPLLSAKVSGLYPAAGDMEQWTVDLIRPFVDDALEIFGTDRLMFGGDWPVSILAGGYSRTWSALSEIFADLDSAGRAAVAGGTASTVYRLAPRLGQPGSENGDSLPR
ncbi:amidohydrolase family protein [Salinibacterium sp. NG22]|uniref:amidohydrolase family protein n=1 Tax=Salinibacterium sp. NG22 TaxID=2792040 RepID=UPI0018CE306F|nr:amidohydrolase family protein [Salinibacterium sp. NG22]MBH0110131.1 amidohydrolase family protein [Salinibacterium sp. NG22]